MNIIETQNLTKIYANKYIALNGVDLVVPQGSVFGLVGPNGAGKTTTIKLLLGLHSATAGGVEVFGERMTPNAVHLRRRMGFLPTNPQFPKDMTPITYLDFVGKLSGLSKELRKPRLAALLRAVDLLGAASQKVKGFSTGMVTRLGIAASLMNDPELLLWDEPTAGLDPEGRKYTIELIRELSQDKTILVSSHILSDIERVCDHVGILSEGKLIFSGPVREMKQLVRSSAVELELEGDIDGLCQRLATREPGLQWERGPSSVTLFFAAEDVVAAELVHVLGMVAEEAVTLTAIHSLRDEMIDAFIRLVEEERSHGFSRVLRVAPKRNAVSGAAGSGSDQSG
jgi:ABC-2 type transport system ATP-binding protein